MSTHFRGCGAPEGARRIRQRIRTPSVLRFSARRPFAFKQALGDHINCLAPFQSGEKLWRALLLDRPSRP
jgi:hypothetical protein